MKLKVLSRYLIALSFAACSSFSLAQADDFKIGLILCLSGECAADGTSALHGAEIAAEEINATGGVLGKKIRFITQDTAEAVSGAKAINAYRQIRFDPEIHYLIGPTWTPGGLTLAPVASKDKTVILMTPSLGVRDFNEAGDNIFNIRGTDDIATRATARVAIESGWKTAAIFSSQQPWESLQAKIFQEEYEKLGGKILAKVEPLPTITTLSSEALKIKVSSPDVVFFSSMVQLGIASKELRKLGWNGHKLAAYVDDTRLQESQGALEGTMFMTFAMPTDAFSKKYEEKFGRKPEIPAAGGYDAVYAYSKAISSTNTFDANKVKRELLSMQFSGASGAIKFDQDGCAIKEPQLWKVENNSLTLKK